MWEKPARNIRYVSTFRKAILRDFSTPKMSQLLRNIYFYQPKYTGSLARKL
jgi:hypothetical protein